MTETFAYGPATEKRPRRKGRGRKIFGGAFGMVAAGAIAFAVFSQFGTGDVTISTTEPNAGATLTLVGSVSFQNTGTTRPMMLQAAPTVDLQATYAQYTTVATSVVTGPCAGFISVVAGTSGSWNSTAGGSDATLSPGGPARFTDAGAGAPTAALDASAPQECANQASISLPVKLLLG